MTIVVEFYHQHRTKKLQKLLRLQGMTSLRQFLFLQYTCFDFDANGNLCHCGVLYVSCMCVHLWHILVNTISYEVKNIMHRFHILYIAVQNTKCTLFLATFEVIWGQQYLIVKTWTRYLKKWIFHLTCKLCLIRYKESMDLVEVNRGQKVKPAQYDISRR